MLSIKTLPIYITVKQYVTLKFHTDLQHIMSLPNRLNNKFKDCSYLVSTENCSIQTYNKK